MLHTFRWARLRSTPYDPRDTQEHHATPLFHSDFRCDDRARQRKLNRADMVFRLFTKGPDAVKITHLLHHERNGREVAVALERHRYDDDPPGKFSCFAVEYEAVDGVLRGASIYLEDPEIPGGQCATLSLGPLNLPRWFNESRSLRHAIRLAEDFLREDHKHFKVESFN